MLAPPDRRGDLPAAHPDALTHSARLAATIREQIRDSGGWIDFGRYMELALYSPGLGYYAAGAAKFGAAGDFVTAPELTPLYGRAMARPIAHALRATGGALLEFGAGSGALACALLPELDRLGALPDRYAILEPSPDLQARQRERIGSLSEDLVRKVEWIATMPEHWSGVAIANEVLDAMPVRVACWQGDAVLERGVALDGDTFVWRERVPAPDDPLVDAARALEVPAGYVSEIGLAGRAWMASLGDMLERGLALIVDYGFPAREYYHPQRNRGTLMCHYRHRAHADPFWLPGLQDITAHVDFSALASAARAAGLQPLGYASQSQALLAWGMLDLLGQVDATDARRYLPLANAVQRLLSPAEMGELFKVLAVGRGMDGVFGIDSGSIERL